MTRVCFRLRVRPELVDEYRERHRAVPDEMLREIAASGRRDYTIFLADDGELVGVFTVDDLAASTAYLAASPIATAWEAESARFFLDLDGRPDQGMRVLDEVFSLDDQLTRSTAS
ncbi:L-rhamnose mutarotase [Schumannella luteola]|uniref:L-rhamnose mutarotase n=1 Tax=Schumannella luteola TaxID=472059 RepID=A0A852Y810_9MICO|nr:L-rhamnose mutarotase [Schumannella luteola]NYG97520.1 L-rhamnose mutarotase [Schumannella luteola]TPX01541.1 L-rhamnose mutarotase [Schumannella luteola]